MKVVAINGSPHKEGNTYHALQCVLEQLHENGIDSEIIHIGNKPISGCIACNKCMKNRDEKCVITTDDTNLWIQKLKDADGILLGSPVHYASLSSNLKSFLDRAFYVAGANGSLFRHKVGAAVVAVRRSGGIPTFHELNNYLTYSEMLLPTSNYWNVIHGTKPGDALQDDEGKQIMRILGKNMAWLLKLVEAGKDSVEEPAPEKKEWTSFIR